MRQPMVIDGYKIRPAKVTVLAPNKLKISIHEGRNRQIRKMCAAVGLGVVTLKRVSIGSLELGRLKSGSWRYMTEQEVAALRGDKPNR